MAIREDMQNLVHAPGNLVVMNVTAFMFMTT
jgi:hypothetical protein